MDNSKMLDFVLDGNIVIPMYLLKKYKSWDLSLEQFIFLMYLQNLGKKISFDPNKFSEELNISLPDVMTFVEELTNKGFIQVETFDNDKGFMEEFILLDHYYNKLKMLVIGDAQKNSEKEKEDADSIFTYLEEQFGKTLSSIDYEIIHTWLESNYSEELIKRAVDEAVSNGVSTLKYIDRILYEWGKKGIQKVEDLDKTKKVKKQNKDKVNDDIDMDIVDWDWFDEEE